jgi:hypothetical protein
MFLFKTKKYMKAIKLFAVISLVVSLSCKKDSANTGSSNLTIGLVNERNVSANGSMSEADKIVLAVKSYNSKTGEIIFNNKLPDIGGEWNIRGNVNVYNRDASLFTLIYTNDALSSSYNQPVLHHSLWDIEKEGISTEENKWYILSGYPYGTVLGDQTIPNNEQFKSFKKEQLINFQKIKFNWDVFVDELKKSGKYIY